MAYRALYRQYRPTTFAGVIGQDHITTTLRHQVESGHVAHAYLFCGSRGTGKTTTARILSRAINCLSPVDGEACGVCEACRTMAGDTAGDILEIDAASNNKVEDIRPLIDKVQYAPLSLKYRVFIIDEAHMITGSAFNALLKTLEEPPAHAVFLLATTEPQKLPATIISRCQRFDFHRLSVQDIVLTLKSVLSQAGADIEEDGLLLIARAANGGMRDALSLADQCLSFCGDRVTTRDVYDVLGSMEESFLFDMSEALLASNAAKALRMLDDIVRGGRDLSVFCQDLASHFRALLLTKTCGDCQDLLDCTADAMKKYQAQAGNASEARLLLATEQLLKAQSDMRYLARPRAMLESTLVRVCRPEEALSLASLEARVDRLEGLSPCMPPDALAVPAPMAVAAQPVQAKAPAVEHISESGKNPEADYDGPPPLDAPPEEGTAVMENASAPAPTTSPKAPVATVATTAAAPRPPSDSAVGSEADALWANVLRGIQAQNVMVYMLAKAGAAQRLDEDTLTVRFPETEEIQFNSLHAPINFNRLQALLTELRPDTKLVLVKGAVEPVSEETTEKVKQLFGDKLIIE